DPKAAEDFDQAATGNHRGKSRAIRPRRSGLARGAFALEDAPVLGRHVPDVQLQDLAVATGQVDHAGRVIGVHVHLHELRLADDENRVDQRLDLDYDEVGVNAVAFVQTPVA